MKLKTVGYSMYYCYTDKVHAGNGKAILSWLDQQGFQSRRSLRLDKDIRILLADKGNCTIILDESVYKKLHMLLESGVSEPLSKDPTATVGRRMQKFLSKHKTILSMGLKRSKPPHLFGLPKIHKPDVPDQ